MQSLMILGRQPALGLAELESLYGNATVTPVGNHAALLDVDPCLVAFERLGGTMKFAKVLTTLDTTNWKEIENFLVKVSPSHSETMPEGKMLLGLSVYGIRVSLPQMLATGLTLKKAIKQTGRPVRLVPNKEPELNTAQVLHNNLTGPNGWELLFVRSGSKTIVGQTVRAQDITSYTIRDRERPKRDARVGMLPPKLAQIIINIAVGKLPEESIASICDIPAGQARPTPVLGKTILDPFCGTGVVLQEALLMGYSAVGSDIDQRMIDYTNENLAWLSKMYPEVANLARGTQTGDATNHHWKETEFIMKADEAVDTKMVPLKIDFVATEAYLGRPFTSLPDPATLMDTISACNIIIKKFLRNIYDQIPSGTRICLGVPAWQTRRGQFKHLPLLDSRSGSSLDALTDMGYNRISFEHVQTDELLYYREDQVVARELLILTKQ